MHTYKDVLKIANEIEKEFKTKCFLGGRGIRKTLKVQPSKKSHYDLIIEPNENVSFNSLKDFYGEMILKDKNEIRLININVLIKPLKEYLDSFYTDIQRIYMDSKGEVYLKGLLNMRKRRIKADNIKDILNTDKFVDLLKLRYEGFYFNEEDCIYIRDNIDVKTILNSIICGIKLKSPNIFRDLAYDFNAIKKLGEYSKFDSIDFGYYVIPFINMLSFKKRTSLDSFILDLFFEYGDRIKEEGLTEYDFFDIYKVISYLYMFIILRDVYNVGNKEFHATRLLSNMGYSDEEILKMFKLFTEYREKCSRKDVACSTRKELINYYIENDFKTDSNFITAVALASFLY